MKVVVTGKTAQGHITSNVTHVPVTKRHAGFGIDGFGVVNDNSIDSPKVRLVIPIFNYGHFLPECLDSLLSQTLTDWTCCVVDDASTDNTVDVMRRYVDDPRIRFVRNPENRGTGASLNYGFSILPPTKYETWFAADNIMYPQLLERLSRELDGDDSVVKVYSDYDIAYFDDSGKLQDTKLGSVVNNGMAYKKERLNQAYFLGIGWLWRRNARELAGAWSEKPCEDYDMARRMTRVGNFRFVPVSLAWYRSHAANMTNQIRAKRSGESLPKPVIKAPERMPLKPLHLPPRGPLVRLVIPTRNYGHFLADCLRSVQSQTMKRWVCCIVDDESTDNTEAVVKPFIADKRFTYLKNSKRLGTGGALNRGFASLPTTPLETWWASDNTMEPEMLERLVDAMKERPIVCAYSNFIFDYRTDGKQVVGSDVLDMRYAPGKMKSYCYVGVCWLWRTDIRETCGEFSTELCEDYDMHIRLEEHGEYVYVPDCLGTYVAHKDNISNGLNADNSGITHEQRIKRSAHERHRSTHKPLKVLNINMEFDCAGVGWRLRNAFAQHSNMEVRHAHGAPAPWCPQTDCLISDRDKFVELVEWADVLHFNEWSWRYKAGSNFFDSMRPCGVEEASIDFLPYLKGKHVVFHMHGGPLQLSPDEYVQMCNEVGATLVVCDPLTESVIPGTVWMPNVLNVEDISQADGKRPFNDCPLKVHVTYASPAVEAAKGVPKIREAMQFLQYRGLPLDYREIHSVDWRECLQQRREDHVCVENLTQGFIGMAGWESLWMGHTVIARLDPVVATRYRDFSFGEPVPIQNVSGIDDMAKKVRTLNSYRGHVEEIGRWSKAWMTRFYSPRRIVRLWEDLYEGQKPFGVQRMSDQ